MSVTREAARHKLYDWIAAGIGDEEAGVIMTAIPTTEWSDVLTKSYLDARLDGANADLSGEVAGFRAESKQDIADLRAELKQEIADVRTELKGDIADLRTELKQEIADVRTELTQEIGDLRSEMYAGFARLDSALRSQLMWMIATMIAMTGVMVAVVMTLR